MSAAQRSLSRLAGLGRPETPGRSIDLGRGRINLTPADVRENYLLYKRDRFIMTEERILDAVAAEGLTPSPQSLADFYATRSVNPVRAARVQPMTQAAARV